MKGERDMDAVKTDTIKLAQFLKLAGVADTGGQAKYLVRTLDITVNGEKENRPGRKLMPGDTVIVQGRKYTV